MNRLDFFFGDQPWEEEKRLLQPGSVVSAARFLTLMEGEDEEYVDEGFAFLEDLGCSLDVRDLPPVAAAGESALRLRMEAQLAQKGLDILELEENDPLRLYLEEVAMTPVFADEQLLAEQAARGKESAMHSLANLGLSRVIGLARDYTGKGVLLLDLIQEGSLGLWRAVQSYQHGDYAAYRDRLIRFYLDKAVILQARSSGVGQKMRTALEDYRAVDERLLCDLGRNATLEEIAAELHMNVEEARNVKKMLDDARMMQRSTPVEEETEPEEEADQAVENTALFQMRQRISDLLSALSPEDAKLLTLRFGLEGGLPMSPEEAGMRLNLTAEEVVAREAAALARLRNEG